mmetsp:Transcript_59193/g.152289  ORF Transcript_59193/g.152289 Transcript_59193/m.152289 type:complete len:204 (-) Transcript_59193:273-884(-)
MQFCAAVSWTSWRPQAASRWSCGRRPTARRGRSGSASRCRRTPRSSAPSSARCASRCAPRGRHRGRCACSATCTTTSGLTGSPCSFGRLHAHAWCPSSPGCRPNSLAQRSTSSTLGRIRTRICGGSSMIWAGGCMTGYPERLSMAKSSSSQPSRMCRRRRRGGINSTGPICMAFCRPSRITRLAAGWWAGRLPALNLAAGADM